ncbi:hypothetical protein vBAbaMD22_26 [Acinetobacter phage vB_AbaM_D22]|nr:hypothetical protein vBAbaMD22_26 [Acinetobacter phage vB_AbaM_D22]
MSRMKLGREKYKVLRHKDGEYNDDGLYIEGGWDEIEIRASYHGGLYWNAVKFGVAGEVSKQAISIRSDQPLYQSSPSDTSNGGKLGDIFIDEDGVHWEVRECRKYKNLRATRHWEAMAVRLDEDEILRK